MLYNITLEAKSYLRLIRLCQQNLKKKSLKRISLAKIMTRMKMLKSGVRDTERKQSKILLWSSFKTVRNSTRYSKN